MKILIAEDDSGFALILRRILEKNGHDVTVTADGAEAWAAMQGEVFPLVISDWMMPRMDGLTLCRNIRVQTAQSYTYVILLTSRTDPQDRLEGLHSGADDFLEKPLARGDLFARLSIARRILAMQHDLQRRAAETELLNARLQMQNEQLEQFTTIACHDLQEPLRKIQMFCSRLVYQRGDTVAPADPVLLERIQSAAERMQALVRDLFELMQVDRAEQVFVAVDMAEIAREVVMDLEPRLQETGGRVEIGALPCVSGDPIQMRQLLQNLIGNGLKYHEPGKAPIVTVSAVGAGLTRLEVADNGIGFDEQYLTRIFAPFQRLHGRGEYEGTGIGLTICKKIVDRHHGAITARSAVGGGATFIVDFPADSTKSQGA